MQALSGWTVPDQPGLMELPDGTLVAVFSGAPTNGSTGSYSGPWEITSMDGGFHWSAPVNVGSHRNEAFTGDFTVQLAAGSPVLTDAAAGQLIIQQGFGVGSPTYMVNAPSNSDSPLGEVDSAVDLTKGQVVASWLSAQHAPSGDFIQEVWPSAGTTEEVPGPSRGSLVLASRNPGPGVFAAYTPDNVHVRLLQYGGATAAIGSRHGVTPQFLGVATGPDGRIWVMWGSPNGKGTIAITRSNKAETRFEPTQQLNSNASFLWRISGVSVHDGSLILLVNMTPGPSAGQGTANGIFETHVLAELSAKVFAKDLKNGKFKLAVKVTDAGDPVAGAKVSAKGKTATTSAKGGATFTVVGAPGAHLTVKIADPGYQVLAKTIKL